MSSQGEVLEIVRVSSPAAQSISRSRSGPMALLSPSLGLLRFPPRVPVHRGGGVGIPGVSSHPQGCGGCDLHPRFLFTGISGIDTGHSFAGHRQGTERLIGMVVRARTQPNSSRIIPRGYTVSVPYRFPLGMHDGTKRSVKELDSDRLSIRGTD